MSPSPPPPGGFRGFMKRWSRGMKKVLRPREQAPSPSPRLVSPQPQPRSQSQSQPHSAPEAPPSSPTHGLQLQPPAPTQQSTISPQPASSVGGSTSTTNLAALATIQSTDAELNTESRLVQIARQAGTDAWTGLKTTLKLVEKSSDVFPPLKSALAGFLGVVDIFETAAQNRKDYADLALNIRGLLDDFTHHPEEHTSSRMSEALKAMASGLEKEMGHVMEQQRRSGFRSHLEGGKDVSDVQACYHHVEILCRELQNRAVLRTWSVVEEQQVEARLKVLDAALKAMYNSKLSAVVGRRTCTPGTRETILAEMRKWADDPDAPKVYWMNGMAGTGKTTLAYSFCAEMERAGRLGATFFCSRTDAESRDVSRIVSTIAHQLARQLPSYREAVIRQIGEDKDICARETGVQFEKLIRDPLREVKAWVPKGMVVTIDALDECDGRDGVQDVLDVLFQHAADLPIKFLVTSRPEPGLLSVLESKNSRHRTLFHLHDVEASFVREDIRTYLNVELHALSLSPEKLGRLVLQAGSLFIYAATVVRYIHPKGRRVDFQRRLDELLSGEAKDENNKHRGIDSLYTVVLEAPFADEEIGGKEKANIRLVLDTAICAKEPMSVVTMAKLLGLTEEDVECALQHLRSVLHVTQNTNLISTLHASFADFMLSSERSKDLWTDAAKHHQHLSLRCFRTMERQLRFNICGLESSFNLDENVPHLAERIENAVSPELFYTCRYWPDHLASAEAVDDARSALEVFLSSRLLFWMEVLNLKRCIYIGAGGLYRVRAWAQRTGCTVSLQQLARDAAGFVRMFSSNAVSRSTPHIYISALAFWPEGRPVTNHYTGKLKGVPKAGGMGMRKLEDAPLAVILTPSRIWCVAYSSDGARIVSGSDDNTVRIWDAHSGEPIVNSLHGHTMAVRSVGYSSDGARVVSGSEDRTIRIWDAHTGKQIGEPLEGHTGPVYSVEYSFDSARIVTGSGDGAIRIWDAHTGKQIGEPLGGHTGPVYSVGYSSNGARIVSGSEDRTIRIWDAHTGKQIGNPLRGHANTVWSVGYSPDGARIVSGSFDSTVLIWDAHTGKQIGEPLRGHTSAVRSVGYASDGTRIVSGSRDNMIRIWDAYTGEPIGNPLEGHTNTVWSVRCSSDGARIVSGSWDNTIRIWDAHTSKQIDEVIEGHTGTVNSVGYSSNGARIVSGSSDKTICIWDAYTGDQVGNPLEGHTGGVYSVGYSSDGVRIVSGSSDNTVRIWDANSGKQIGDPLEGHTNTVMSVGYSSDGAHIVSGSWDSTIRIWDAHTGKTIGEPLEGHVGPVYSVRYSPDGARIVSGSEDSTIRIWDACNGKQVGETLKDHTSGVMSVEYSSDCARIVSGSSDSTIRIWDAHTGKTIGEPLKGHADTVTSVMYSSDGTRIVSGSSDQTIRIWDAHTGKQIGAPIQSHTHMVRSVGYSSDGAHIVSGSLDETIRIHNLAPLPNHPRNSWVLDREGFMLVDGSKRLMWVPSDVWDTLLRPRNTAIISRRGSVKVDFTGTHIGASWSRCYRSS